MLQNWIPNGGKPVLELTVANASKTDAAFLKTMVALFSDPANEAIAEKIRSGQFAIQYHPKTGAAHVIDLELDEPGNSAGALVDFLASINPQDWEAVKSKHKQIVGRFLRSEESARRYVSELLGKAWFPRRRSRNEG